MTYAKPDGKGIADPYDQQNVSAPSLGSKNDEDVGFDVKVPRHHDTDDEITDVDDGSDEADKGPNAAEALRAQSMMAAMKTQLTLSENSSGSSSCSDNNGNNEDLVNSI
ncbi:hypothetical protein Patl1_15257 [Pistacia atlantica]|uniref:Uncharacterized protein n=1 Tax=Pistacia atlantica TaxID=434234 RepID=A0ACC1B725_9ROSI|nr:hypothetical protein Patl1_15257 [Pistacia atlantica]